MASGPDHYKAAEALLAEAAIAAPGSDEEMSAVAAAQVHASLALAAATYDASPGPYVAAWDKVLDPKDGTR